MKSLTALLGLFHSKKPFRKIILRRYKNFKILKIIDNLELKFMFRHHTKALPDIFKLIFCHLMEYLAVQHQKYTK